MSVAHVAMVKRWFEEVWNQRRADAIPELTHADGVAHTADGAHRDARDFTEDFHAQFLRAFPDMLVAVEEAVPAGEDVVVRWLFTGTHTGEGFGLAPTGKRVRVRGVTWVKFRDGRMAEGWDFWNQDGLFLALREGRDFLVA